VIAGCGGSPTCPQTDTVPGPQAPTADFTFSATNLSVAFTDASSDPDGSIASWSWDFGDGAGTSTEQSPGYTYASAGDYSVILTITDDQGATDHVTKTVSVAATAPSILVRAGSTTTSTIAVGEDLTIPVVVDMSGAAGLNIASLTAKVTWDTNAIGYVKSGQGSLGSATINASPGSGELLASWFNLAGVTEAFTAFEVTLEGIAPGTTAVTIEVSVAGDESGLTNLLPYISTRGRTVTVQN
jgi:PKD repeat protein